MSRNSEPFVKPPRRRNITTKKILNRFYREGKGVYQRIRYATNDSQTILFIAGCQRSGTTLLTNIFDRDLNAKMYPEVSKLTSQDTNRQLRLNPLPSVKSAIEDEKAPLIILKPLVESQNILDLLEFFEGSRSVWIYRNYKDVAASHIQKWGNRNSINDLKAIVDALPDNWRFEKVTSETRNFVREYYSDDMDPYDAASLYWYVRNILFLQLRLAENPRVMICKYEDLVSHPSLVINRIYSFVGIQYPGDRIVKGVHSNSVNKGSGIEVSAEIDARCRTLLNEMDRMSSNTNAPFHQENLAGVGSRLFSP